MSNQPQKPAPFQASKALIARLTRLTTTLPGLDASLMVAQYTSPIVIALLLRLAKFRADHPRIRMGDKAAVAGAGAGLVRLAAGWGKAAVSIGEARVVMRAFGILPMLQAILALHPDPLASLRSLIFSPTRALSLKNLPTMQVMALLCYYPLEHIAWLGSKGVLNIAPERLGRAALWSVRFWALYVVLNIVKLRGTQLGLKAKTRAMRSAKPAVKPSEAEGYELQSDSQEKVAAGPTAAGPNPADQIKQLTGEWVDWKDAVIVNAGYAPLTIHWSTPGGLWTNPLLTAVFGTLAAYGQWTTQWRKTAA